MIYLLLLQQITPLAYHLLSHWENRAGRAGQLWTGPHPRLPLSQRPAQRHSPPCSEVQPCLHSEKTKLCIVRLGIAGLVSHNVAKVVCV